MHHIQDPGTMDPYNLKHLVLRGIPDQPTQTHIRPLVWDILLDIHPSIAQRRHDYHDLMSYFVKQLLPHPTDTTLDQTLRWIQADITRTQSDLQFFSTPFRLSPDSPAAAKLNLFSSHLNRTQPSDPNLPPPPPSLFSNSSSPAPSSSSSYYSSSSRSKTDSLSTTTTATTRTKPSPSPSPPTDLSASSPSRLTQAPQVHSINTLLEPSSPSTPRLSLQAPSPINSPGEPTIIPFTYRDLISRLLAVWSTLNPGIGYVQGMNDIAAVMLYVYGQPHHPPASQVLEDGVNYENMEADAFWAFSALVSNLRELFVNSRDGTSTKVESGFKNIFDLYARQLAWLDLELSYHLRDLGVEGKFFLLSWVGCLFTRCFELPDLLRLWDSLLALNLDTHQASVTTNPQPTSINQDDVLINSLIDVCCALTIQLAPTLRQQDTFDRVMGILQGVRMQNLSVENVILEVLIIRQRRLAAGLDHQSDPVTTSHNPVGDQNRLAGHPNYEASEINHPNDSTQTIFGSSSWSGLTRLKTLATDVTQKIPSQSDLADNLPHETAGAGIFQKLKHTTEGWRDSDVAAELSKKATNWSIMASSWGAKNSLISKLSNPETSAGTLDPSPIPSFSPPNRRFPHAYDSTLQRSSAASSPQASSHRWSKTSHTSNLSFDSPFQPPISSCSDSLSGSSSTLGSPIYSNHQGNGHGPRPLLLSSSARTNVNTTPESSGKVQDMVNASIKRLSGIKLGINLNGQQSDNSDNPLHIAPVHRTSSNVKLAYEIPAGLHPSSSPSTVQDSTMVNIFSRNRARSVMSSSPIRDRHKGDLSGKPERVSLPNGIQGRHDHVGSIQRPDQVDVKSEEAQAIQSTPRKPMQKNQMILKENITSGLSSSNRVNGDTFDDVVDEYASFYDEV